MNARNPVQLIPGWVKLAAALILLAGLLLGGILAPAIPVQALNAAPQITAPRGPLTRGVNGTLASFTALFPEFYTVNIPVLMK